MGAIASGGLSRVRGGATALLRTPSVAGKNLCRGRARGYAIAVLVSVAVPVAISPDFWANITEGSHDPRAAGDRLVTSPKVLGSSTMPGLKLRYV